MDFLFPLGVHVGGFLSRTGLIYTCFFNKNKTKWQHLWMLFSYVIVAHL